MMMMMMMMMMMSFSILLTSLTCSTTSIPQSENSPSYILYFNIAIDLSIRKHHYLQF